MILHMGSPLGWANWRLGPHHRVTPFSKGITAESASRSDYFPSSDGDYLTRPGDRYTNMGIYGPGVIELSAS